MNQIILIEDYNEELDSKFKQEIAIPYFKTIFSDVAKRSVTPKSEETPEVFVDNVAFFEYTKLPGIICDRFFNVFKRSKTTNLIVESSFIQGFIDIYLSDLRTKMELTFKM